MKKIKWIGPKHYPSFGVCEPGQIVTEAQISHEVMKKWVSQGMAEWVVEEKKPVIEVIKKHKTKREA